MNAMPIAKMETTELPTSVGWTVPSTRVQNEEATGSDLQETGFPTVIPNQLHLTTEPSSDSGLVTTNLPFEAPKVTTLEPLGTTAEPFGSDVTTKLVEMTTTLPRRDAGYSELVTEATSEAGDTTTVIATSISTSEAIVYFSPGNQNENKSEESSPVYKLF